MNSGSEFDKNEKTLASEWRLGVPELSEVRHGYLRAGIHYRTAPGNVFYSSLGIEELLKHVTPEKETCDPPFERPHVRCLPPSYPLSDTVVAVDRIWANPRLIRVIDVAGRTYSIRVGSNKKFRRGMRINMATQTRRLAKNNTFGERLEFSDVLPRFNGRW